MKSVAAKLCPSARCEEGAQLLGVVKDDGHVDIIKHPFPIDGTFIEVANQGQAAETKFRFTNKCIKSGCAQWTGERCGIIDKIIDHIKDEPQRYAIPDCSIRPNCRWYHQQGQEACKACPLVVRNVIDQDTAKEDLAVA